LLKKIRKRSQAPHLRINSLSYNSCPTYIEQAVYAKMRYYQHLPKM